MVTGKRVRWSTYGYGFSLDCEDEEGWVEVVGACVALAVMW